MRVYSSERSIHRAFLYPEILGQRDALVCSMALLKWCTVLFAAHPLFDHFNGLMVWWSEWVTWSQQALGYWIGSSKVQMRWRGAPVTIGGLDQTKRLYISLNMIEIYRITLQIFSACHMMLIYAAGTFVLIAWTAQVLVLLILVRTDGTFFNNRIQFSLLLQILFKSIPKFQETEGLIVMGANILNIRLLEAA